MTSSKIPCMNGKKHAYDTRAPSLIYSNNLPLKNGAKMSTFDEIFRAKPTNNPPKELSHFNVGNEVMIFTNCADELYGNTHKTFTTCKIEKINKCSITVRQYQFETDKTDLVRAVGNRPTAKYFSIGKIDCQGIDMYVE